MVRSSGNSRTADPFAELKPLFDAVRKAPLPPVLFLSGDDDWFVAEASHRVVSSFRDAFREGEVSEYEATGEGVREATADAATIALFATNRLVVLDATEVFRVRKLTAEEIDALLDEAGESRNEARTLQRLAKRARALAAAGGVAVDEDVEEAARKLTGRVKRTERSGELAELLAIGADEGEQAPSAADVLVDYVSRAKASDNALLVRAVSPEPSHHATQLLRQAGPWADFTASDDGERRERLNALGLECALDRGARVAAEVFDVLTERGRLAARPFLSELNRLIDTAAGGAITADEAARLVADERKEYGSDFVEAVASRRPLQALRLLERLLSGGEFTAFRPFGAREEAPGRKGPRGEAAFFPLLGLLAAEIRRMLALRAAADERGLPGKRLDYRTFADRLLPALKAGHPGVPPFHLDAHPFVLHRAYLASLDWSLDDLIEALLGLEAVDRGVKTGAGTGSELLQAWLLGLVPSVPVEAPRRT